MNNVISTALLSQAFGIYEDELIKEYEGESFAPSENFKKKLTKLIKSQTSIYYRFTMTKARRIVVVAAIIAALLAASLSVDAIRDRIFSFFVTHDRNVELLESSTDAPQTYPTTIERTYFPSFLPVGYTLEDSAGDGESSYIYYTNGKEFLSIEQFTKAGYKSASDVEYETDTRENLDGVDYIIKTSEDMTLLIWEKDGYVFELTGFEGTDELLKVAASMDKGAKA